MTYDLNKDRKIDGSAVELYIYTSIDQPSKEMVGFIN